MRVRKFYRAFPELNEYSDEAVEGKMWQARARRADAMWVIPLGVIAVVAGPIVVLGGILARAVHRASGAGSYWDNSGVTATWTATALVFLALAVVIWVWVRRALIIRSVLNHLNRAQCPYCLFSLEGLVLELGAVRCPECGVRVVIADHGITPEDLAARRTNVTWTPARAEAAELTPLPLAEASGKKKPIRALRRFGTAGLGRTGRDDDAAGGGA